MRRGVTVTHEHEGRPVTEFFGLTGAAPSMNRLRAMANRRYRYLQREGFTVTKPATGWKKRPEEQ